VPYSLLSTGAADAVVKQLAELVGNGRGPLSRGEETALRQELTDSVTSTRSGDPALVDLNELFAKQDEKKAAKEADEAAKTTGKPPGSPPTDKVKGQGVQDLEKLVIKQTKKKPESGGGDKSVETFVGPGVGVFVYPSSPKAQRESLLTRLTDEKAYRRLAISTDIKNWADIALQSMPIQPPRPGPDLSAAIALFEQIQRLGLGMAPGAAAAANRHLWRLERQSRNGDLTDGEVAQVEEYAAIAELASRLAAFAAGKGGDGFGGKGGDGFGGKGGDGFGGKGGDGFVGKGGDGFVGGP